MKQKNFNKNQNSTSDGILAILTIIASFFFLLLLLLSGPQKTVVESDLTEPYKQTSKVENLIQTVEFENLITELTKAPKWKDYDKVKSCLIRNVFYESPRYFPGMERKFGLTSEEMLWKIQEERVRILNVTFNRMKSEQYSNDVCEVVYQYKQFSWTLDSSKKKTPLYKKYKHDDIELYNIREIERLVEYAMEHGLPDITEGAMYYHTVEIKPYWKHSKEFVLASIWHKYYKEDDA